MHRCTLRRCFLNRTVLLLCYVDFEPNSGSQLTPGSFSFRISEVHLMHLVHQAGEASLHQLKGPMKKPADRYLEIKCICKLTTSCNESFIY
eukprot:s1473_g12.t1